MVSIKDSIKIVAGVLIILLLLQIIFFSGIFGRIDFVFIIITVIIFSGIIIFAFVKYFPLIRVTIKGMSAPEYSFETAKALLNDNVEIPAEIDEDTKTFKKPLDIKFSIATGENLENYILSYENRGVTHTCFFDGTHRKVRGIIIGDPLHLRPQEAVKKALELDKMMRTGVPPEIVVHPGMVRELQTVIEREGKKKPEEEKPKK